MPLFLTTLREGGPSFSVGPAEEGFLIVRQPGCEVEFNEIAREVIDKAGPWYAAFPRPDGHGGYDCVHVIPLE